MSDGPPGWLFAGRPCDVEALRISQGLRVNQNRGDECGFLALDISSSRKSCARRFKLRARTDYRIPQSCTPGSLRPELYCSRSQEARLRDDTIGILYPFAYPTPGVARVDHLLHLEPVERADRAARAFDTRADLGP